jgi:hypothetical protein
MNRSSSSKAQEANAPGLWRRARQLLRAFAGAGHRPLAFGVQSNTWSVCSLFRRRRRHPWIANRRLRLSSRSRREARSIRRSRLASSRQKSHDQSDLTTTSISASL